MQTSAPLVFLRSLLNDPRSVGAVLPSSSRLSELIASDVDPHSPAVLEVGAGTGSVTKALLRRGLGADRLIIIERDPHFVSYLRHQFPGVHVKCGDAFDAARLLSHGSVGKFKTVVSSLPIRNLPRRERIAFVRTMLDTLAPNGHMIQFTYGAGCPIPTHRLGVRAHCLGRVWMNFPPAAVWRFTRR